MSEDWLTNAWTVAGIAYLLGVVSGWLIWRVVKADGVDGRTDHRGDLATDSAEDPRPDSHGKDGSPTAAKLAALEAEIRQAQSTLEADAQEHAATAEILTDLDDAVKRANGRLKLILNAIKRGRIDD